MAEKKDKPKTNPNGANQYLLDPRQQDCWRYYIDRKGKTYGNAYRSALKAGYADQTATNITTEKWFKEKWRKLNLLSKAEKVLDEDLELQTVVPIIGMFGPIIDKETKKPLTKVDPDLRRIRQSSATFLASRLGKNDGYSTRQELTGADGTELPAPIYAGTAS